MGFYQGLSGLNASEKALNVIGHNISNATTVGYKSQTAHFSDIYAGSIGDNALGRSQVGSGTFISDIATNYGQGSPVSTGNDLDMAINGAGFFRLVDNAGGVAYSRNGQFYLDKNGYVRNATAKDMMLTGFPVDASGKIISNTPTSLYVDNPMMDPAATTEAFLRSNLDSRSEAPAVDFALPTATTTPPTTSYNMGTAQQVYDSLGNPHALNYYFVKTEPNKWTMFMSVDNGANNNVKLNIDGASSNYLNLQQFQSDNTELNDLITQYPELADIIRNTYPPATPTTPADAQTAFDTAYADMLATQPGYGDLATLYPTGADFLNAPESAQLKAYLDRLADADDPEADEMRAEITALRANAIDIEFDSNGHVVSLANPSQIGITIVGLQTTTGAYGPGEALDPGGELVDLGDLPFNLDISGTTQFGQSSSFTRNNANGNTAGDYYGVAVSDNGVVSAKYTNGEERILGQVALATFPSAHGLARLGDNLYGETFDSGQPVVGAANTGLNGTIVAQSTEESNVNLTSELIQMIIQQRSYQANAQTIKTQDSILQTIVSLR